MTAVARRPKQDDPGRDGVEVTILGSGTVAGRVRASIRRLGMLPVRPPGPQALLRQLRPSTHLVVLAPPLPDLSVADCCRAIRTHRAGERIPILVVAGSPMTMRQHRELYAAGASGRFDWPSEQAAFVRALLRCTGKSGRRAASTARSLALAAKLEQQIESDRAFSGSRLKIAVQRGTVFLGGETDALWKVRKAVDLLSARPEVQDVVADGVRVARAGIPDRSLALAARNVLRHAMPKVAATLGFDVTNGHVTVSGSVADRQDMQRVIQLLEQIDGIRSIDNLVTISPRTQARDRTAAQRLARMVRNSFPRARVDVSVFSGVAVVRGRADGAVERRAIESALLRQPGIERIVSKVV
jgi:osmotically-inducible protein OsmY